MNIFHKHDFIHVGDNIEYQHLTDKKNWKEHGKDVCPYPDCTKKARTYLCKSCGSTKMLQVDL